MEGFFICIKHIKMGQARPYNILDIHNFEFMEEEAILSFFFVFRQTFTFFAKCYTIIPVK